MSTFYIVAEDFRERVRVYMNRVDHYLMSLKVLALYLGSSFMIVIISYCWNLRKVNLSLLTKCFWIFLIDWFLKCLSRCFKGFFFRGGCLFNFTVLVKFVKYLFKVCDIFSLSLIILSFSWRMIVF